MVKKELLTNAEELVNRALVILKGRNDKYNIGDEDRLGQFKRAANLQHITPLQAAAGHASKHIVCLQDMIASGEAYPRSVWEEELVDNLNYILLMHNVINEMEDELICAEPAPAKPKAKDK